MTDRPPHPAALLAVIGGGGKTGRRVARRLADRGAAVRPLSRSTPIIFDWATPATWRSALEGVAGAYVSYQPDLAVARAADDIARLADLAVSLGLERLVLLSGRGEDGAGRAEEALMARHPGATVVRAGWFCQNFCESYFHAGVMAGELVLPVGPVAEPFVDADDVADVAAAALLDDGHAGRIYEVTGPELLSFADAAEKLSAALGRRIVFRATGWEEFAGALAAAAVPAEILALLHHLFTETLDGRNARLADGVRQALGREPRSFAAYATAAAAAGAWDAG